MVREALHVGAFGGKTTRMVRFPEVLYGFKEIGFEGKMEQFSLQSHMG